MSEEKKVLQIPETITVAELAELLDITATTLIGDLFKQGIMATINQKLDFDTVSILIEEMGINAKVEKKESDLVERKEHKLSDKAKTRPPIVAVMGHVDHGKTTLLDNIMKMKKVDDEAGGITQHISAYQAEQNGRTITFLDTPGHEAFAALRQHGAVLTDVVIIVVAADDGVMPQTVEAIKFAKNANAKIVVAINKIDKSGANQNLVMTQLASEHGLNPEEWGGDTIMVPVSAKTGEGIEKLLDMVLLVADMEELKADFRGKSEGLIIEANKETGRGNVVHALIEHGELEVGEIIVAGDAWAKVKTLENWRGEPIKKAGPATPVIITGFKELPAFGEQFEEVKNEREARSLAAKHYDEAVNSTAGANITGNDLLKMMNKTTNLEEVGIVIKADVQGSLTSVIDSLKLLNTDEVAVKIIASGVGDITENDLRLAGENGIIYGFSVAVPAQVEQMARREKKSVKIYSVIYELLDDAKSEMSKKLAPEVIENEIGELEVQGVFRTTKDEIICGGKVKRGKITPNLLVRVFRKKENLGECEIVSLQREKNEAKEVFEGDMCGMTLKLNKKIVLEVGDRLEFFTRELKQRSL